MIDDFSYTDQSQKPAVYKTLPDFFIKADAHHYNPLDILVNISLFKTFPKPNFLYGLNLFFFYGNTLLLFFLIKNLTKNLEASTLTAILFAVHPVNAENLCHITLNSVFFSGGFLQGSMLCFWQQISTLQKTKIWLWVSIFLFIVGILFLETALLFPMYLVPLCMSVAAKERSKTLQLTMPFWLITFGYFILWTFMAGPGGHFKDKIHYLDISILNYSATLSFLLKWYLQNLLFPNNFVFIKNSSPIGQLMNLWNIGLLLSIIFIIFLCWIWRKTLKHFALSWFIIGFTFLIPAGIVHAYSMGIVIEPHWFYFSSMGFFMLFSLLIIDIKKLIQPALYGLLLFTIISYWGITSYRHHVIAQTEIGYLEYWLKNSPRNLLPALMLGNIYENYKSLPIPNELLPEMKYQSEYFIKTGQYHQAARLQEKIIALQPFDTNRKLLEHNLLILKVLALESEGQFTEAKAILTENSAQTTGDARFPKLLQDISNIEENLIKNRQKPPK